MIFCYSAVTNDQNKNSPYNNSHKSWTYKTLSNLWHFKAVNVKFDYYKAKGHSKVLQPRSLLKKNSANFLFGHFSRHHLVLFSILTDPISIQSKQSRAITSSAELRSRIRVSDFDAEKKIFCLKPKFILGKDLRLGSILSYPVWRTLHLISYLLKRSSLVLQDPSEHRKTGSDVSLSELCNFIGLSNFALEWNLGPLCIFKSL